MKVEKKEDKKAQSIQHEGKYQFTDADKRVLSQELAEECLRVATITAEKKKVTSEFAAKLSACEAKIQRISEKISNGHEPRVFECIVEKDFENKSIRFIDIDTDKVIEERKMSAHEFQIGIGDNVIDDNDQSETGKVVDDKSDEETSEKGK